MEHHEQPKYGGSSPWNWSSQACAGGGMTDHSVGIEMSGIFLEFMKDLVSELVLDLTIMVIGKDLS